VFKEHLRKFLDRRLFYEISPFGGETQVNLLKVFQINHKAYSKDHRYKQQRLCQPRQWLQHIRNQLPIDQLAMAEKYSVAQASH
jgi:hypothetical protein